ncbi:hypothetical protein [Streptomyces sp. NPDC092307]|uniref:hypothetical protein n=1 Tax=Streptomyces sp. NPDC092307 TaxID=3366013 RepID=UPI00380B3149
MTHSPADADRIAPDSPDTVYARTTDDARITDVLLREVQPGDLLRITGTATQPGDPEAPAHFTVDALEVLEAAPLPVAGSALSPAGSTPSSLRRNEEPGRCGGG